VAHLAEALELPRDPPKGVGRDGECDAIAPALSEHSDHAPVGVQQRTARVARVDRGIGLDRVLDRRAVRGVDAATDGGDHTRCDGAPEAVGIPDRHREVARPHALRVAERQHAETLGRGSSQPQDGEIGRGIAPNHAGSETAAVSMDHDLVRAGDHVVVRDYARAVDREAGAGGHAVVLAWPSPWPGDAGRPPLHDEHGAARLLVDLLDRPVTRLGRLRSCRRFVVARRAGRKQDRGHRRPGRDAADHCCQERRDRAHATDPTKGLVNAG
jgi:hypothetical protein